MTYRRLMSILLTLGLLWLATPDFIHAQQMYWTDTTADTIQRANLDGTDVVELATTGDFATSIALDQAGGKMYWTNALGNITDASIQRANLDGTVIETLIVEPDVNGPNGLSLDVAEGKMYWVDQLNDVIQRANLDGTNIETLLTISSTGNANSMTLDLAAGKMYWVTSNDIRRANLDGSDVETVVPSLSRPGISIAVDPAGGKVYWVELFPSDSVKRANLDGTAVETLASTTAPFEITLDLAGGKMYWTGRDEIHRANLDGTDIEVLLTGSGFRGIALLLAPTCSSSVTTIPGLMAEVDGLTTSVKTVNTLNNTLGNVETALSNENFTTARGRMENFISKAVNRSNFKESNSDRILLDEANSLICGGRECPDRHPA